MLLLPLPSEIFILESPAVASILPPTPSRLTVIKPFDPMRSLSVPSTLKSISEDPVSSPSSARKLNWPSDAYM